MVGCMTVWLVPRAIRSPKIYAHYHSEKTFIKEKECRNVIHLTGIFSMKYGVREYARPATKTIYETLIS